jgi:glutathione S-transferase
MAWIELVSVLALVQYMWFGVQVGGARGKYGIKAPAVAGHEVFERIYRVQMNTLEQLVVFLPVLWMAARYWNPVWMAAIGAVYLVGRMLYRGSYIKDPGSRTLGFLLTILPTTVLLLATLLGAGMALLKV